MKRRVVAALAVVFSIVVAHAPFAKSQPPQPNAPSDADVQAAIERGVAYLRKEQTPQGHWAYRFNSDHTLGITALAGLALLENGVDRVDPAVASANEVVHTLAGKSNQTYDLALAILFLARVQAESRGSNDDLIQRLADRLEGGERGGMWGYNVPLDPPETQREPNNRRRARSVRSEAGVGDNSNTQFALLGIWAAGRHDFDPNRALEMLDEHFRNSQTPDGRWGYQLGRNGTESMTCAGLMGLAMSAARPSVAERQTARARGAALAADPVFSKALKTVEHDARRIGPGTDVYYIWSLERVCVALGLRQLDGYDWYAAGAHELLRRQRGDGGWPDVQWGELPNTCLALLFLRKANLAFELDRVLKLPSAAHVAAPNKKTETLLAAAPLPSATPNAPGNDEHDAGVVVTGASDEKFPKITVEFEVKKPDGAFLLDAKQEDFRVTEDGQPVKIESLISPLATEARPTTVVLVVDRSLSMKEDDKIGALKRSVATFLKGLPKGSRVAVVAFGSEVRTICPFTENAEKVQTAVDSLRPGGATRYYDAVAEALEMINAEPGRRAVLALTDGEDTFSQSASIDSVIVAARRQGIPIHTLGLGSEDEIESDALKRLASETRGQYYPAREADQLRSIYEQLAERLRSTYTLVYNTQRQLPDGTLRPVRVFYRASRNVGETAVFIPGMVVPAGGWPGLFVFLVVALMILAALPGWIARRPKGRDANLAP